MYISLASIAGAVALVAATLFGLVEIAKYRALLKKDDMRRARRAARTQAQVASEEAATTGAPSQEPEDDPEEKAVRATVLKVRQLQYAVEGKLPDPRSSLVAVGYDGGRSSVLGLLGRHAFDYTRGFAADELRPVAPVPAVASEGSRPAAR